MGELRLLGCIVDLSTGAVHGPVDGHLTERELDLLRYLAERPEVELSRETLLSEVFGYAPHVASRAVDKTLFTLRQKVERDATEPDHILTVRGVGYRFVPHRATDEDPGPPAAGDRFVGRAVELGWLREHLARPGLVTLTGPGGVGKTRLAVEAARARGPARLAQLGEARTEHEVRCQVAQALGVPLGRIGPALAALGDAALILDAAEGCVAPVSHVVGRLAAEAPAARLLVTSRRLLGAQGERVLVVEPLDPASAVELLGERVRLRGFPLHPDGAGALVDALDRLPLSIELAAGWLALMDPAELAIRARSGEGPLALEGVLARSWDLLDEVERTALVELTVFEGGFDVRAAEAVLSPPADGRAPLKVLHDLLAASLVQRWRVAGAVRLGLLDTVRQAVAARSSGTRAGRAHAAHYADLGDQHASRAHVTEVANLVRAGRTCVAEGAVEDALRCLQGVRQAATLGPAEALHLALAREVLGAADTPHTRAQALLELAWGTWTLDRSDESAVCVAEALSLAADAPELGSWAHQLRVGHMEHRGDAAGALAAAEASLALAHSPFRRGIALRSLAACAQDAGDWEAAREHSLRAIEHLDDAGAAYQAAVARFHLGITQFHAGDLEGALRLYRRAEVELERLGSRRILAAVRGNVGNVLGAMGRREEAIVWHHRAVDEARAGGDRGGTCQWLLNLGGKLLALGRLEEARAVLEEGRELMPFLHAMARAHGEILWGRLLLDEGRATEAVEVLREARRAMEASGDALYLIPSCCALSVALRAAGRIEEADVVWQEAEDRARALGVRDTPQVRAMFGEA